MSGWKGVDLDGTLAIYTGWVNEEHIGEPVPKIANAIKKNMDAGIEMRIFTARVFGKEAGSKTHQVIEAWCLKHLGYTLPITCTKDYGMIELWDDRAIQVIPNTGERADGGEW
jgi:hypothetical protein